MRISSFRYLLKNGLRNLWTNRMMTVASVGTLVACLLIVGLAILFSINIDSMVEYVGQQNELVVFMTLDSTEEDHVVLAEDIAGLDGLGDVVYISREQAMEAVVEKYLEGDAGLLEGMDTDFLPASFRVRILAPEQTDALVLSIGRMDFVEKVEAPTELTSTLVEIRRLINLFGGGIILALIAVSMVIITNTIRASVFTRRKEINIMKYVGATNSFIRVPFVVEGIALGIIAAGLAFFITWGGYDLFIGMLGTGSKTLLGDLTSHILPFDVIRWHLLACYMIAGVVIGGIGSTSSMRGYLKV
ncbi:MAG: permease-like cell division protein FtsX [Oscillospiraceae bacterium]|nr:permease-like cell division protein FtsX [Oscillospiraceae bacterium]